MTLGDMREKILRDADAKARGIEHEGRQEEARILAEAREKAKAVMDAARAEAKRRADLLVTEHNAEVEIEKHNAVLIAKDEAVAANRERILKAVLAGIADSYPKVLKGAVDQMNATAGVDEGDILIRADAEGRKLLKGTKYKVEDADSGVHIQTRDNRIAIDITPESMLRLNIGRIDGLISSALFEHRGAHQHARKMTPVPKAKARAAPKKAAAGKKAKGEK